MSNADNVFLFFCSSDQCLLRDARRRRDKSWPKVVYSKLEDKLVFDEPEFQSSNLKSMMRAESEELFSATNIKGETTQMNQIISSEVEIGEIRNGNVEHLQNLMESSDGTLIRPCCGCRYNPLLVSINIPDLVQNHVGQDKPRSKPLFTIGDETSSEDQTSTEEDVLINL